jgi:predicted nucleotidyltransferase
MFFSALSAISAVKKSISLTAEISNEWITVVFQGIHMKYEEDLGEIISIITKINPEKIYLFGSRASRFSDGQSDIDLIIVAPSNESPLERRMELRRMLVEYDRRIGLDLLVYTPDEFSMLANEPSSFISSAIKQGVKVYDREAS